MLRSLIKLLHKYKVSEALWKSKIINFENGEKTGHLCDSEGSMVVGASQFGPSISETDKSNANNPLLQSRYMTQQMTLLSQHLWDLVELKIPIMHVQPTDLQQLCDAHMSQ